MPRKPAMNMSEDLKRERKEKMKAYLKQFDEQMQTQIDQLRKQAERLCADVMNSFKVERLRLSKSLLATPLLSVCGKDYEDDFSYMPLKTTTKSSNSHRSNRKRMQNYKTKTVGSSIKRPKMSSRKKEQITPFKPTVVATPVFTPKFDPRLPITRATGLRRIKPGEKFVMMSMSGSPLIHDAEFDVPAVISTEDGKTIAVSSEMDVPTDVDKDTKSKIELMKQQLSALRLMQL